MVKWIEARDINDTLNQIRIEGDNKDWPYCILMDEVDSKNSWKIKQFLIYLLCNIK